MYQSTSPCPRCGTRNLNGTWVCVSCGATLIVYCPHCRAGNNAGSQFCQFCGLPLAINEQYPQYPQQQPQQAQPQYMYQQEPYPPQYEPYTPYQQQAGPGYPGYPAAGNWQTRLNQFVYQAKQFISRVNPTLLLMLGILIIGMAGFLAYAFQSGMIKTGEPDREQGPIDTTPPVISLIQVKAGQGTSAIISWVTDEYSSSQVQWGIYPAPSQLTPIQNDPTTGLNRGVLIHEVALSPLAPKTTYLYRVISVDKYGNKAVYPPDSNPPMEFQTTQYQ